MAPGKPKETVAIEPVGPDGSVKYGRAAAGVHPVPRRSLNWVIVG
ncbi:MAG: hypothetical protein ACYC4L_10440 [Chloroflexota bacterium]